MSIISNQTSPYLELNEFQIKYRSAITGLIPGTPPEPWNPNMVVSAAGVLAGGWTLDNHVLLHSPDGFSITDPFLQKTVMYSDPYTGLVKNNSQFKIPETQELVPIFGIWGGDGNHFTSDGWLLEVLYPSWPNSVVALREPAINGINRNIWEGVHLINLVRLEYAELKCGFSNDEKHFLILGSGGAEIYSR